MKKASLILFTFVLALCVQVGSVFAATSSLTDIVDDLMGVQYKWAGTSEKGFDCSGFTRYVFDKLNIDLPHSSRGQADYGNAVAKDKLRPGDLVFFNTGGSGISHVGIYLGNNTFAHAASDDGVTKSKLTESYYAKRYVTARRIMSNDQYDKFVLN